MPTPPYSDTATDRAQINRAFFAGVRHNLALGIEILTLGRDTAVLRMPPAPHLVGEPTLRWMHGGPLTSLLDAACGAAVFQAIPTPAPIATLGLRIDHLTAADSDLMVTAHAHCHRVTRDVAFVRARATQGPDQQVVAEATASFMIGTRPGARTQTISHDVWTS